MKAGKVYSCELLSEFITFVIHHNFSLLHQFLLWVVNCFQNLLPLWYITTTIFRWLWSIMLWIAFRIYYLCDTSQQTMKKLELKLSCELLSEFITFVIHHNGINYAGIRTRVVNCFQNLLPLWYITTRWGNFTCAILLWIAFRIYYLCDTSQQRIKLTTKKQGCELLSEFITFVIHHNL